MSLASRNKLINRLEVRLGRPRMFSKPVGVDVVLTKACNFACTFCKDYETEGAKRISVENFERMARQLMPTASRLNFCSGGEPYLHTGLEELLRIARRYNPDLYTWVLSNGSILRENRLRTILEEDLITEHGFSVDGVRAATVESIRINAKFDVIMKNIKMLLDLRRDLGKKRPSVTIRYALMRSNIEELADAVEMWGELGVERIDGGYVSLANGMDRDLSLFYHQDLARACFEKARNVASRYKHLTIRLPALVSDEKHLVDNPDKCRFPWRFVMVDTNGQILPCYQAFEALRFESIYDADVSFDEIWNSTKYQQLRSTVNNDSVPKFFPYCAQCETRYGSSREDPHLGDESWAKALGEEWLPDGVHHKRPLKGTAAREP